MPHADSTPTESPRPAEPIQVRIVDSGSSAERTVSYCAAIIAILSFIVSIWQGWTGREHNRLSVRPVLAISERFMGVEWDGLRIANHGGGVAEITSTHIYLDGRHVCDMTNGWWRNVCTASGMTSSIPVASEWYRPGCIVEVGPWRDLLVWRVDRGLDPDGRSRTAFEAIVRKRLGVQITYRSLYDEVWRLKYSFGASSVDRLPAGGDRFDD